VDEVKRFYGLYSAGDNIQWITGPGGHGNLGPISPAIMAFFVKNLKGGAGESTFAPLRAAQTADMIVTPSGQVSSAIGGETVYSLNRGRAQAMMAHANVLSSKGDLSKLQNQLRKDIRSLTGAAVEPGSTPPSVTILTTARRDGYRIDTISMKSDAGMEVSGLAAVPDGTTARPAILMMDTASTDIVMAKHSDFGRLAEEGNIVVYLQPRPTPPGTESIKSPYLGPFNLLSLRAFLVGKTMIGLRIDDAVRAVDWLASRKDVDRNSITIYGNGPLGMAALHAAALDSRNSKVVLQNTLTSFRMIVDQPVHRNVSEVVIPGVLRHYDTEELLQSVYPRTVVVVTPQDALGETVSEQTFRVAMANVIQSDQKLGSPKRIQFQSFVWFAQPLN
jgi:hypothetical protein